MTPSELEPTTFRPVANCQSKLRHSALHFLPLATLSFCINRPVFGRIDVSTKADVFVELIASSTKLSCGIKVRGIYLGVRGGELWFRSYIQMLGGPVLFCQLLVQVPERVSLLLIRR